MQVCAVYVAIFGDGNYLVLHAPLPAFVKESVSKDNACSNTRSPSLLPHTLIL